MTTTEASITNFIRELESQKTILTSATQLFTTLTSHFASLEKTLAEKNRALDSKFQSLDSLSAGTLGSLAERESSIPERESAAAARIDELKEAALADLAGAGEKLGNSLRALCRRMDSAGLLRFVIAKRKESVALRVEIPKVVAEEAVDPAALVLEAVEEFVRDKAGKVGVTDKRWACGMLVQALFEQGDGGVGVGELLFSRKAVERAWRVLERWRDDGDGGGGGGGIVGPAEAVMYLQTVVGFGLRDRFEEEYLRGIVLEHATRRDMAKVASGLMFGEALGDIIDELVKNGKEIEAVYFATESNMTERFPPVSLLKSFHKNLKKNTITILKKGNHSSAAKDEANALELTSIKSIIKCVEDHKLESEFPLDSLKKKVSQLEKFKSERKRNLAAAFKPQHKRVHGSNGGRSGAGAPSNSRPAKVPKFTNNSPSLGRMNQAAAHQLSPVTRYPTAYNYPNQNSYPSETVYEGHTTHPYGSTTYGISHSQSPAAVSQQHYTLPVENMAGAGYRPSNSYGGQTNYVAYDYTPSSAAAATSYPPPS